MITHSTVGRDEQSNGTSNSLCGMLPISSIPMGDLLVASRSPRCFWNCGFRFHSICLRNHKHVGDEPVVSLENGYFCFIHVNWNCRSRFKFKFSSFGLRICPFDKEQSLQLSDQVEMFFNHL